MTAVRVPLQAEAPAPASHAMVRLAAYGTLSNGSDVQLLAQPTDGDLTLETRRSLRAFFNAAWKAAPRREQSYFAFMPLEDDEQWALSRVSRRGRGAAGWVVVVWSAIFTSAELAGIEWATHRLLQNAFPEPGLPDLGTRYAPHKARLDPASVPSLEAYRPAFDWLLKDIDLFHGRRAAIRVEAPREPGLEPLTPEGALFGLWSRLGRNRADCSYCSWAGLESDDYPPLDLPFRAVFADADAVIQDRPGREILTIGASADGGRGPRLPPSVEIIRSLQGVTFPAAAVVEREAEAAAAGGLLAQAFYDQYGDDLVRGADDRSFGEIARGAAAPTTLYPLCMRLGLFELLGLTLTAAEPGRRRRIVDTFIDTAWPHLGASADTVRRTADEVLEGGAAPFLSAKALRRLGGALFADTGERSAFAASTIRRLDLGPATQIDWFAIADEVMRGPGWRLPGAAPLLERLVLATWPSDPATAMLRNIAAAHGFDAVRDLPAQPGLTPSARESLLVAVLRLRRAPDRSASVADHVRYRGLCFWARNAVRGLLGARKVEGRVDHHPGGPR